MNMLQMSTVLPLLCSCLCLPAQDEKPAKVAGKEQDPLAEMLAAFKEGGIDLDREAKTISIKAELGKPDQPLEYLLINPRGKGHEALLVTDVKPSLLNAALLALGYEKGQNARMKDKDPLPTLEEIEKGASLVDIFPPEGMELWFTVAWEEDGKQREVPVEDLLVELSTQAVPVDVKWIFLGGRMAAPYRGDPPVFLADYAGNLVSICYLEPPNHLATMSHERAGDDQNWWIETELCPKSETEVKLTIHRQKPDLVKKREAAQAKDKKGETKRP
ncbi:MAG: YdjY domain-containing protein [Planctomycetota bacterium]|jgi:hypothetical protein